MSKMPSWTQWSRFSQHVRKTDFFEKETTKMTLNKKIEALRYAVHDCRKMLSEAGFHKESGIVYMTENAIASLPEPMSEEELLIVVRDYVKGKANPAMVKDIIQALKSAGCLLVRE